MRVLHVGKYYYPYRGGMETHLQLLCNELKRSVDLEVLVCNSERKQTTDVIDGVRVTRCFEVARVLSTSLCPTMPFEFARRHYDVVHFHFPHPVGVMSYLAGRRSRPHAVVVTYHADIVRQLRMMKAYRPFQRMLLDRADAIVCATPDYLESSRELDGYRHKAHVIPFGLDVAHLTRTPAVDRAAKELRARYGQRPIVLGVGRLVPYKGFEYLVRAMPSVDATLLIVGIGPEREALERLARECGVADRTHFLGEIDDVTLRASYEACDLFALPSVDRSEAFALVQIEAMAVSKPIVNTAIPGSGVPWVSRDGESGLTVPPRDASALAQAMNRIFGDRALAERFGRAGRARVERDFTTRRMAERTLDLYRAVAPRSRDTVAHSERAPVNSYKNP